MGDSRSDRSYSSSGTIRGHSVRFWTSAVDPSAIRCFPRLKTIKSHAVSVTVVRESPVLELPEVTNEAAFQPERASTSVSHRPSTAELFQKPLSPVRPPLRNGPNKKSTRAPKIAKPPANRVDLPPPLPDPAPVATDKESCASFRTTRTSVPDTIFSEASPKRPRTYRSAYNSRLFSQFRMRSQAPSLKAVPVVDKPLSPVIDRYSFDSPVPIITSKKSKVEAEKKSVSSGQTIAQRLTSRKRDKIPLVEPKKVSDKRSYSSVVVGNNSRKRPAGTSKDRFPVKKVNHPVTTSKVAAVLRKGRVEREPSPPEAPAPEVRQPEVAPAVKAVAVQTSPVPVVTKTADENRTQMTANLGKLINKMQNESEDTSVQSGIIKSLTDLLVKKERYEVVMEKQLTKLQQSTSMILECSKESSDLNQQIRTVTKSLQESNLSSRSR